MAGNNFYGDGEGRARVISIISGKGGVGKTTLVSNLGIALARRFKKRVLAIDANITTANLGIHMGLQRMPVTLHDVLENKIPITSAIYESYGVDVIPAAHSIGNEKTLKWLRSKIRPLLSDYDFVLLDSSPGLGLEARWALSAADELLLVTNPELSAVTEVIKMVELARKKEIPVTGIVLNRAAGREWEVEVPEIEESCGIKVMAIVPEDVTVPMSVSVRIPAVIYNPRSRVSAAFYGLAAKIAGAGVGGGPPIRLVKTLRDFAGRLASAAKTIERFAKPMFAKPIPSQEGFASDLERPKAPFSNPSIALSLKPPPRGEKEKTQAPLREEEAPVPVGGEVEKKADADEEEEREWLKESPPLPDEGEPVRVYDDDNIDGEEKKAD